MTPESRVALIELCKAQEAEIGRLRALLDDYHRGKAALPETPLPYDASGQCFENPSEEATA